MRIHLILLLALTLMLLGCGGADQPADTPEASEEAAMALSESTAGASTTGKNVPDPCSLLSPDEAAILGGPVEPGAEDEVAFDFIRKCTWDSDTSGFYGVSVMLTRGGLDKVREMSMIIGEEQALTDMGMPAFLEMIMGGVGGITVEQDDFAVQVYPVWTDRPDPDSERVATLKDIALLVAGRL